MKLLLLTLLLVGVTLGKHHTKDQYERKEEKCTEEFKGCRLLKGECVCETAVACSNPFPYLSEHQCQKDLNGDLDKCRKDPCENGQCVQVKTSEGYRKWRCSCAGSGFHGKRCQHECPIIKEGVPVPEDYPTDCIY